MRIARGLGIQPGNNDELPGLILGANPLDLETDDSSCKTSAEGWTITDFANSRIWSHPRVEDLYFEMDGYGNPGSALRSWSFVIHSIYSKAIEIGGLPLHAALIERDGLALVLAGASGCGKSTCCRRLPATWKVLSDDHALLLPSAVHGFCAHPFPTWSDLLRGDHIGSYDVQNKVSLSVIFFLEQAQCDEVESIGQIETALRIYHSTNQIFGCNIENMERAQRRRTRIRLFENACKISKSMKSYILRASLAGRFWDRINDVWPVPIRQG